MFASLSIAPSVAASPLLTRSRAQHRFTRGAGLGSRRLRTNASALERTQEESSERDLSRVIKRRWDVLLQPGE